jgi:hypothetical protein
LMLWSIGEASWLLLLLLDGAAYLWFERKI